MPPNQLKANLHKSLQMLGDAFLTTKISKLLKLLLITPVTAFTGCCINTTLSTGYTTLSTGYTTLSTAYTALTTAHTTLNNVYIT